MKISRQWLQNYIDLAPRSNAEIAYALTMVGFEVEGIEETGIPQLQNVVVGEIDSFEQHPNADRLSVCQVDVGDGTLRNIVCGAKNFKAKDRVLVALPGAVLPGDFKIKKGNLRGVKSEGMLCSQKELGLGADHAGIAILADRPALGTPVNEVFTEAGDSIFDIEITPNRPDALSHLGIARELAAWFKLELKYPEIRFNPATAPAGKLIDSLEVTVPERCPHYRGYSIRGVKISESPAWLKAALSAIGLRPINNVVDCTNYVLHELGQPLHAFDAGKIKGGRIVVRTAAAGEKLTTLDDKVRLLDPSMTVIADAEKSLVVAGVMGSVDAEVDSSTVDVFLEAAWFDPASTRKTARALTLSTDSSYRFERGVDPKGAEFAALRCLDLILQTAGGEILGPPLVVGAPPAIEKEITLSPAFVRERLGFEVPDEAIIESLRALELDVREGTDANGELSLRVGIPSFRLDLYRPIDLVEEVIRIHGCDKIPEADVRTHGLIAEDAPAPAFLRRVSTLLVGRGFNEAMHYSLRDGRELGDWYPGLDDACLALTNPLASDASHLRPSLLPGLIDCLKLNQARLNEPERVFETGRVFRVYQGKTYEMVSAAFVLSLKPAGRWSQREVPDYYTASQIVTDLFAQAGVTADPARFVPVASDHKIWQQGHAATFGDFRMGFEAEFGLLASNLTASRDVEGLVLAGAVYLTPEFLKRGLKRKKYSAFSAFPPATRDLALLVDAGTPAGQVASSVEKLASGIVKGKFALERVRIFDVYLGQGSPEGKKSVALNLVFRADDRTLNDKEVAAVFDALQARIAGETTYAVRS